jgi:hypothetical protein
MRPLTLHHNSGAPQQAPVSAILPMVLRRCRGPYTVASPSARGTRPSPRSTSPSSRPPPAVIFCRRGAVARGLAHRAPIPRDTTPLLSSYSPVRRSPLSIARGRRLSLAGLEAWLGYDVVGVRADRTPRTNPRAKCFRGPLNFLHGTGDLPGKRQDASETLSRKEGRCPEQDSTPTQPA